MGDKTPSSPRSLTLNAKETLCSTHDYTKNASLAQYDLQQPIQVLIFNSLPTVFGAQEILEWLHTTVGGAPQLLTETLYPT